MDWNFLFFFNSALLGVGLAMDTFSVSVANALREPGMPHGRMCRIAGVYAGFQALMPMLGWVCVHTVVEHFRAFQRFVPWIALGLLVFIGAKMLDEGLSGGGEDAPEPRLGAGTLLVQGLATSIDALSVGFTTAEYSFPMALVSALIIAAVTFVICMGGLLLGRRVGERLAGRASILGGLILIAIGCEIFLKSYI